MALLAVALFCTPLVAALSAKPAWAGDGAQFSLDCQQILVNKRVGDEQWAITYQLNEDLVLGNVFRSSGDPSFLACSITAVSSTVSPVELTLQCYGSDKCNASPCGGTQWNLISEVKLRQSFFLPPGVDEGLDPSIQCAEVDQF